MKKVTYIIRRAFAFALMLWGSNVAWADEGMWMIHTADKKVQQYAKAVVSIDFMGTGSIISDNGLVITNHHVAYGDIFALSTEEHNYLEDGFWAATLADEIPIPGRKIQILRETRDVTDEVEALFADGTVKNGGMAMRRLSSIIEKKYEEETGLMASLGSFWSGSRYYVSLYEEYSDIRLVAAPPVSIGAFGGDVDNWEWPQQKCDFTMLRIYVSPDGSPASYSPDNIPLQSPAKLTVSKKGYRKGSKTMVIGFPGRTDRYAPSSKVDHLCNVTLPIACEVRGGQMAIIRKWMDADPQIRLKYSDYFFNMSNVQELYEGQLSCYKRFHVAEERALEEKELQQWIEQDDERCQKWGTLLSDLEAKYKAVENAERNVNYYRECLFRGSRLGVIATRTASAASPRGQGNGHANFKRSNRDTYAQIDLRVEKDIFRQTVETYYENMDDKLLGPFQKELKDKFGNDYESLCDVLWTGSWMTDSQQWTELLAEDRFLSREDVTAMAEDSLVRFFNDVKYVDIAQISRDIQGNPDISALNREYVRAFYLMNESKGKKQYPNANSTMRVSYGKVGGYSPCDAVWCDWKSTTAGILAKHDPIAHDFCLKPQWKEELQKVDGNMIVDFLTDNDITGGNSGSPVLDSKGRLIGLAFDGNKESLASDISFTPACNRCVNVDIRFILWTLEHYAHMDRIIDEIF